MLGEERTAQSTIKARILLLVSDRLVRSVMQEILERDGYAVFPASDVGGATALLKDISPDLLVTRIFVSGMTGHEAAKYLRNHCMHMRVLMVGGLLDDDRLRYREALQGFEVFPKPYSAAELLEKVKEVLRPVPATT
jgi:DNA-binding response OmpR family regulator